MVHWVKNWLKGRAQSLVVTEATSGWRQATIGVPQDSVLGPALFSILSMISLEELNVPLASLPVIPNWEVLMTLLKDRRPCRGI